MSCNISLKAIKDNTARKLSSNESIYSWSLKAIKDNTARKLVVGDRRVGKSLKAIKDNTARKPQIRLKAIFTFNYL